MQSLLSQPHPLYRKPRRRRFAVSSCRRPDHVRYTQHRRHRPYARLRHPAVLRHQVAFSVGARYLIVVQAAAPVDLQATPVPHQPMVSVQAVATPVPAVPVARVAMQVLVDPLALVVPCTPHVRALLPVAPADVPVVREHVQPLVLHVQVALARDPAGPVARLAVLLPRWAKRHVHSVQAVPRVVGVSSIRRAKKAR